MVKYYVNDNTDEKGNHEVHTIDCYWLQIASSKTYLGEFASCHGAVIAAKKIYRKVDGCKHCSEDCHSD